jgi:hypothetical protein
METKKLKAIFHKPPADIVAAAESVFMAMTHESMVQPIVEGYQKKILEYEKYPVAEKWHKHRGVTWEDYIKDPDKAYLMQDGDFKHFLKRCREEQAKAKLKTDTPEQCPLLVAENLTRMAKQLLIDLLEPFTGCNVHNLLCAGLEKYDQYIELNLQWLSQFVDTKKTMQRFAKVS